MPPPLPAKGRAPPAAWVPACAALRGRWNELAMHPVRGDRILFHPSSRFKTGAVLKDSKGIVIVSDRGRRSFLFVVCALVLLVAASAQAVHFCRPHLLQSSGLAAVRSSTSDTGPCLLCLMAQPSTVAPSAVDLMVRPDCTALRARVSARAKGFLVSSELDARSPPTQVPLPLA